MTNTPGNGWPGGPPPQGPGSTPPGWGAQPWPPAAQPPAPQQYPPQQYPPQQYPQQQYPGPPGATQPTGPQASRFDPTRALGEAPPQSVSINQFAPPPNRTPMIATIVALVVLALVIGVGSYVRSQPAQPSASPSATPTASAEPGQPFSAPGGQQGRWQILDQKWTDEGLQLQLRIDADSAALSFSFIAFANASTTVVQPTASSASPDLRTGTAAPGRPATGYVFFPMPREDATIILATATGRQISALPVKG